MLGLSQLRVLPVLTWDDVQREGHKTRAGIYKPSDSPYVYSLLSNVGESVPNYEDRLSQGALYYHGRGRDRDQTLDDYDNGALFLNMKDGVPVRVFAGGSNRYRDWGLWLPVGLEHVEGDDGFRKLIYRLLPQYIPPPHDQQTPTIDQESIRFPTGATLSERIVRYAPELAKLKEAYGRICQVDSRHSLPGRLRKPVEVHHLEAIGSGGSLVSPNHGNELVLCPNCHALFDEGALYVDPDDGVTLRHFSGDSRYEGRQLRFVSGHVLDKEVLRRMHEKLYRG